MDACQGDPPALSLLLRGTQTLAVRRVLGGQDTEETNAAAAPEVHSLPQELPWAPGGCLVIHGTLMLPSDSAWVSLPWYNLLISQPWPLPHHPAATPHKLAASSSWVAVEKGYQKEDPRGALNKDKPTFLPYL